MIRAHRLFGMVATLCAAVGLAAEGAQTPAPRTIKDITYATVDGRPLGLDLYLPAGVSKPSLLVWVHGGAWRSGSKSSVPSGLTQSGFAVASLDFRQSTDARFPAMVHDIKGAIRFLRANAATYGYGTTRIAIGGDSSGGHLAVLVGVTSGVAELEGTVGGNAGQSSAVQAILDYYGATDLTTILAQSTPFGLGVRQPALDLLLGAQPENVKPLAELASPVLHIDAKDPPLLIFHGDRDPQMPINQSHELQGAYEKMNLDVAFVVVHGSAHGGQAFYTNANLERAVAFLKRTIGTQ
ncbi:MAG: alpha/beta hydrolase [Acidobacteriota bacterium]